MCVASLWTSVNVAGIMMENYESESRTIAGLVTNVIGNTFTRPITVAQTMAKDKTMVDILSIRSVDEDRRSEADIADHLRYFRDGMGYSITFAINDTTHSYHTPNGITRTIDPDHDPGLDWYIRAMESENDYTLDPDVDEAANWTLSVFVNHVVTDKTGRRLGLCGVGVDMSELQNLLERYERIYNIRIDLIDKDGLIKVDSDLAKVDKEYIAIEDLDQYNDGEMYYETVDYGSRTITYMPDLEWYLIIQNNNQAKQISFNVWLPAIVCALIGIAGTLVIYWLAYRDDDLYW